MEPTGSGKMAIDGVDTEEAANDACVVNVDWSSNQMLSPPMGLFGGSTTGEKEGGRPTGTRKGWTPRNPGGLGAWWG